MVDRTSLFKVSGLPDPFGVVVLVFSFILLLSPYLSGADFGVFKVPVFAPPAKKWLRLIGPAFFVVCVLSFLPILPGNDFKQQESAKSNPELKPVLSGERAFFLDGFGGSELDSKWKIIEEDRKKWTLQSSPPSLLIVTQKGSIWESRKNLKNQFVLERNLPGTNFEIIVKATLLIQDVGNSLSVSIFKDDDDFLEIGYCAQPWGQNLRRVPHFTKEEDGRRIPLIGENRGYTAAEAPETFYLRIQRDGNQFNGYYSFVVNKAPDNIDDIRWTKIGTHVWINFDGRLALWADNGDGPTEVGAQFSFVLIRPTSSSTSQHIEKTRSHHSKVALAS